MAPRPLHRPAPSMARRLYSSRRWRDTAAELVARFPVCQVCQVRPSKDAHHAEPHRGDPDRFWSIPLLAVCTVCHKAATGRERGWTPRPRVDVRGRVHDGD